MASADDLFAGGMPAIKFPEIGVRHRMTITRVGDRGVERDAATGEVKTFPSGDPRPMIVCDVKVDQIDPAIEDDDGSRTLYLQGMLLRAVIDAVRAARQPGLRPSGVLEVVHHDVKASTKKGFGDTKLFKARYTPPTGGGSDDLFGEPAAVKKSTPVDDDPPW